jgi:hypothetical protein
MIADFAWLLVVAGACAVNMAGHILWFRTFPEGGMFRAMLSGFVAGSIGFGFLSSAFFDHSGWWHLLNLAIYACFSYAYFHWNNMGETGRRVRLMIELRTAPEGLTRAELLARYGNHEIINRRLDRMIGSHQIYQVGTRFRLGNQSFLAMARIVALFKRLLDVE